MRSVLRSKACWIVAYFLLAATDFAYSLYSGRLSRWLTALLFVFVAIGWDWWFRRLSKENEIIKLGLSGKIGKGTSFTRAN